MFAALYGELMRHPWRVPDSDRDAYLLFHERSQAMGWLDDIATAMRKTAAGVKTRQVGAEGLWGMNDAGHEHLHPAAGLPLAAWFQVGVMPVAAARAMPMQPFLCCAGDAMARIGTLRLQAVQVLLPVEALDTASRPQPDLLPSLLNAEWFSDSDPECRTSVRIRLDSGQVPSISSAAPRMHEQIRRLDQNVFVCESLSLADHDPLPMQPPFADHFWNGPPVHQATFHGTLAEWSLDALGWLGGFLADLSACHGVTTPVLLTASPADAALSG